MNKQHDGVFLSPDNLLRRVKVIAHGLSGFGGEARRQKAVDNARIHVFSRLFFKRFDLFAACHFNWPFLRHMQNGSFDVQPSVRPHLAKARRRVSVIQNQLNKASRSGNHAPRRIRGADRDNRIPFYFKVFRTQLFTQHRVAVFDGNSGNPRPRGIGFHKGRDLHHLRFFHRVFPHSPLISFARQQETKCLGISSCSSCGL